MEIGDCMGKDKEGTKYKKKSGKETMEKEDKRQEKQDSKGYNSSRKMCDPRSGKSHKFHNKTYAWRNRRSLCRMYSRDRVVFLMC